MKWNRHSHSPAKSRVTNIAAQHQRSDGTEYSSPGKGRLVKHKYNK